MAVMPAQKPGRSVQDYGTPAVLLEAVKRRFGIEAFTCDLAASAANAVCPRYYTEADDALDRRTIWPLGGWNWLNPPFANIRPWVARAWFESGAGVATLVLVPASTGANWWRDFVHKKALVLMLNGRVTFVGETTPYPKDCAILVYAPQVGSGYEIWTWGEAREARERV